MAALSRSFLLLACLIALLPMHSAPAMAASSQSAEIAATSTQQPTLDENLESIPIGIRASERVEIGSAGKRDATRMLDPQATAPGHRPEPQVPADSVVSATWCDVVQCHRMAGALLLRYATSPPSR